MFVIWIPPVIQVLNKLAFKFSLWKFFCPKTSKCVRQDSNVLLIRTNMFPFLKRSNLIQFSLQMVVDIYVNYDCDLSSANIFERLVTFLNFLLFVKIRKIRIFKLSQTNVFLQPVVVAKWSKALSQIQVENALCPSFESQWRQCIYVMEGSDFEWSIDKRLH